MCVCRPHSSPARYLQQRITALLLAWAARLWCQWERGGERDECRDTNRRKGVSVILTSAFLFLQVLVLIFCCHFKAFKWFVKEQQEAASDLASPSPSIISSKAQKRTNTLHDNKELLCYHLAREGSFNKAAKGAFHCGGMNVLHLCCCLTQQVCHLLCASCTEVDVAWRREDCMGIRGRPGQSGEGEHHTGPNGWGARGTDLFPDDSSD